MRKVNVVIKIKDLRTITKKNKIDIANLEEAGYNVKTQKAEEQMIEVNQVIPAFDNWLKKDSSFKKFPIKHIGIVEEKEYQSPNPKIGFEIHFYPEIVGDQVRINTKKSFGSKHPISIDRDQEPIRLGLASWARYKGYHKEENFEDGKPVKSLMIVAEAFELTKVGRIETIRINRLSPESEGRNVVGIAWDKETDGLTFQFFGKDLNFVEAKIEDFKAFGSVNNLNVAIKRICPKFREASLPRFLKEKIRTHYLEKNPAMKALAGLKF
jgi:hypothetical protein